MRGPEMQSRRTVAPPTRLRARAIRQRALVADAVERRTLGHGGEDATASASDSVCSIGSQGVPRARRVPEPPGFLPVPASSPSAWTDDAHAWPAPRDAFGSGVLNAAT